MPSCLLCHATFPAGRRVGGTGGGRYCSSTCLQTANRAKWRKQNPERPLRLTNGTVGALHEIVVCADLLRRGYHVFRAISPSCPCDLIATRNGDSLRVEVTTGSYGRDDAVSYPRHKVERFDLIAVVTTRDTMIRYMRPDGTPWTPESGEAEGDLGLEAG